jgi:hypothetical protein
MTENSAIFDRRSIVWQYVISLTKELGRTKSLRVSSCDQSTDTQVQKLKAAGCQVVDDPFSLGKRNWSQFLRCLESKFPN